MAGEKNYLFILRKEHLKTQQEIADYLGIDQSSYNRLEKANINSISVSTLSKLAKLYNVSTDNIISSGETTTPKTAKLPVLGLIAAGIPIEAAEDIIDYIDVPADMVNSGGYFGLKIRGDSMSPRICHNDIVILKKQESCDSGDVCAVMINGDNATLKQVKREVDGIWLIPFNNDYKHRFYTNKEIEELPVTVIGKVVEGRYSF